MITVITGENSFENERILARVVADFDASPEKVDGETLELRHLPDLVMGMSLFATQRLVIIKNMSANKTLWSDFEQWIPRVSEDIHVVLVDPKLDKRTKTFKLLQKTARLHESKLFTDRDAVRVEQWVIEEADRLGVEKMDKKSAQALVARVGIDQWALFGALQKLAVLDEITPEIIADIVEPNPAENAFGLFEAALKGDGKKVVRMLEVLSKTEDSYRLFGLVSGQAVQMAVLAVADVPESVVAADLGVHPFVVSKLGPFAKRKGRSGAKEIVGYFAEADVAMKTSAADPWLLLERALLKTAKIAR